MSKDIINDKYEPDFPTFLRKFYVSLKDQVIKQGYNAVIIDIEVRGEDVSNSPNDICKLYNIPFYEKYFIDSIDLDKFQNINMEDVIKYLTQGQGSWNYKPNIELPTNFNKVNEEANLEKEGADQEYPKIEDEYKVAFQPQFPILNGFIIRSPTRHAPLTIGSSHQTHVKGKGKGKAPMEMMRALQRDEEED
ncbi:hypothetical protein J1N35_014175 [Gossypium stocksii]|uniref:Uncharacterized protein n=1 Tax=Gossypium stocksii TaxID=47602 RepID=A0A9D3VVW7_9ROSI|nr:hypothetical protein J1N35_014175 [Gossypium stocksii]